MRYLVTGGYGFIGSNLVEELLKNNHNVTVIDRRNICKAISNNPRVKEWNNTNFTYKKNLEIYNEPIYSALNKLDMNFDGIVHLAANPGVQLSIENPTLDLEENLINTFNILEKIRSSKKATGTMIFASSAAPLAGNIDFPLHNNLPLRPLSPYGASKAAAECYLKAYKNSYNIKTCILRFSNVYGPGSLLKKSVVANMIKSGLDKGEITINGNGNQTRDFVYIDDLVKCIIYALENGGSELPIHVCSSKPTTINNLTEMITKSLRDLAKVDIKVLYKDSLIADALENYSCNKYPLSMGFPKVRELNQNLINNTVQDFLDHNG